MEFSYLDENEEILTKFQFVIAVEESDEEVEELEPQKRREQPVQAISEWDFATEMKKFVFGILEKGEPGLPWHCLLLYLCRDVSYPVALQKAFTILGAPM